MSGPRRPPLPGEPRLVVWDRAPVPSREGLPGGRRVEPPASGPGHPQLPFLRGVTEPVTSSPEPSFFPIKGQLGDPRDRPYGARP